MRSRDQDLRAQAAIEISRRLPVLSEADYRSYDDITRGRMLRALEGDDVEVAIAMLDAFQRFEDAAALPHVERLLAREEKRNTASRLAEKARECRDALRASAQTSYASLLRPAEVESDLLRPAESANHSEPNELLRASAGDNVVEK